MIPGALLEALLFAHGAPLEKRVVCRLTGWSDAELEEALSELRQSLQGRGLQVQAWRGTMELVSHPEAAPLIRQFRDDEARGELSKTALETIAVFLYKGSLTRPELEEIRGMYSHQILRSLSRRGLVTETGETRVGQPVYDVTPLCLQWLGLTSREDLPDISTFMKEITESDHADTGESASRVNVSGV